MSKTTRRVNVVFQGYHFSFTGFEVMTYPTRRISKKQVVRRDHEDEPSWHLHGDGGVSRIRLNPKKLYKRQARHAMRRHTKLQLFKELRYGIEFQASPEYKLNIRINDELL